MKIAGIVLGVLVVLVGVLGVVAPKEINIEREITIEKNKNIVFAEILMMKNHKKWSPWEKLDPNNQVTYQGTDGTVGAIMSWSGNKDVGVGEQEIMKIADGDRIDYELRFKEPMQDTALVWLATEGLGPDQTRVKWGMNSKAPFPINIMCMVLGLSKKLEKDYDQGLASLKQHLEGGSQH